MVKNVKDISEDIFQVVLNPNQRQILENDVRLREKLAHLDPENSTDRKEKKQSDLTADMLDKHDSFYHTTKSLLVLFQIMGVMPIMRNKSATSKARTTFTWCSAAFMWAYLIYGCETVIVVLVANERVGRFLSNNDKSFDQVIYNLIFISFLLPHFLLPVASWRNGPEVAKFKNMWTHYQTQFLKVTGTPIVFPYLYSLTWGLCIFSWLVSLGLILSQYYLQPDFYFWHTFAYYHIIAMLNGFCSLWYVNCTAFGRASEALSAAMQITLQSEKPAKKLTEYRHLWVDLSHMMQQLGKAYSNMYGIYCLVIFFTTIIATYGSLSEIVDHGFTFKEIGYFVIVGYTMSLLFIICNEAYHATRKVGQNFQERLLNVNFIAVDIATQKEVEMFLVAIAKNPPTMNLNGYANINRKLITSNISFLTTYLIILLQFKLTLLRQSSKKALLESLRARLANNGSEILAALQNGTVSMASLLRGNQ